MTPLAPLPCRAPSPCWALGRGQEGEEVGPTQQRNKNTVLFMESLVQPLGSAEPS